MLWAARSAGGFAKACTRIALHVVCCAIELGVALILCLAGRRWLVLHALLGIASIESEMANAKDVGLLTDVFCCLRRGPPFCVHGILGAWCEARLAFPQGGRKRDPASDSSFRGICLWVRRFSHLPSVAVVCVCGALPFGPSRGIHRGRWWRETGSVDSQSLLGLVVRGAPRQQQGQRQAAPTHTAHTAWHRSATARMTARKLARARGRLPHLFAWRRRR